MSKRVAVNPNEAGAVALNPTASAVDRFAAPRSGQQMARLAESLGELAPRLGAVALGVQRQENEEATAEGEAAGRAAMQEQGITSWKAYREAVKAGTIKREDNPFFQAGLQRQFGTLAAQRIGADLAAEIAADPNMAESTDPAAFDKKLAEFMPSWLEKNAGESGQSPFFSSGFANADGVLMSLRNQFAARAAANGSKAADAMYYNIPSGILQQEGLSDEDKLVALQTQLTDTYTGDPTNGARIADRTIAAITDYALLKRDPELAKTLLEKLKTGTAPLSVRESAVKALTELPRQVGMAAEYDRKQAENEAKRADKAAVEDFTVAINETVVAAAESGQIADLQPYYKQLEQYRSDPELYNKQKAALDKISARAGNMATTSDLRSMRKLTDKWLAGTLTAAEISGAMGDGAITPKDAQSLFGKMKSGRADEFRAKVERSQGWATYGELDKQFSALQRGVPPHKAATFAYGAALLLSEFRSDYSKWLFDNPDADWQAQDKYAKERAKLLSGKYTGSFEQMLKNATSVTNAFFDQMYPQK